jgi:hypothetical protein
MKPASAPQAYTWWPTINDRSGQVGHHRLVHQAGAAGQASSAVGSDSTGT